jgi:hypothetical protein
LYQVRAFFVLCIEPYRLGIVRDRKIVILAYVVREAATHEGATILGIESYRFCEVGNRPLVVALAGIRVAAAEEGRGIVSIERNRAGGCSRYGGDRDKMRPANSGEIRNAAIVVLLRAVGDAAVVKARSILRSSLTASL